MIINTLNNFIIVLATFENFNVNIYCEKIEIFI